MNREILFRGKRIDNNEWIYGSLIVLASGRTLIMQKCEINGVVPGIEVTPSTVGQFTGLLDKKGKQRQSRK